MHTDRQQVLEELIHRELNKLPERQAPSTLISGVLARVQARARKHWWQCPWSQWPLSIRLAVLPLMLASVCGVVLGLTSAWRAMLASSGFGVVSGTWTWLSGAWEVLSALGNAVLIVGRAAGQESLLLWLFVPLTMYFACVGLGTLCYRMALQNR